MVPRRIISVDRLNSFRKIERKFCIIGSTVRTGSEPEPNLSEPVLSVLVLVLFSPVNFVAVLVLVRGQGA